MQVQSINLGKLSLLYFIVKVEGKTMKTIGLMGPLVVRNMNKNPLCEHAHKREPAVASFTPQHIWICKCFPAQKALTSCYYIIPVGADTTAWKYIIGGRASEQRSHRQLPGRCGHVTCMHAAVGARTCVCVFPQRNVIMLVVFPYRSPEYEMCWVVQVMMGLVTKGKSKEINSDHNSKQQAAMTPIDLKSSWWLCLCRNNCLYK